MFIIFPNFNRLHYKMRIISDKISTLEQQTQI